MKRRQLQNQPVAVMAVVAALHTHTHTHSGCDNVTQVNCVAAEQQHHYTDAQIILLMIVIQMSIYIVFKNRSRTHAYVTWSNDLVCELLFD